MSVSLLATLHCRKDAELALSAELKKLVDGSVKEQGCIAYELYQHKDDPLRYVIKEEWTDEEALDAHRNTPHHKYFLHVTPVLLERPAELKVLVRLI